jgi:hypothetical protein
MLAGGKTDDGEPGLAVAERRNRRVPPVRMLVPALLAERDEPGA